MFSKQLILRIIYEQRMLLIWIGVGIFAFVFSAIIYRQSVVSQQQEAPPVDNNVYY